MKLSFYFDVYPWTKETDIVYARTGVDSEKHSGAKRYRVDVEVEDPCQPDEIIQGTVKEVIFHHSV